MTIARGVFILSMIVFAGVGVYFFVNAWQAVIGFIGGVIIMIAVENDHSTKGAWMVVGFLTILISHTLV